MYGSITSNRFRSKKEESKGDGRGGERKTERVTLIPPSPPNTPLKPKFHQGLPRLLKL